MNEEEEEWREIFFIQKSNKKNEGNKEQRFDVHRFVIAPRKKARRGI